jgi:GNAT superfamily N-acetyltransferase
MSYQFRMVPKQHFDRIVPLVYALNEGNVEEAVLTLRFNEMKHQNYECAGIYDTDDTLVGVSGLWFCTRHYSGKSVELDHVFIAQEHRNNGLGKQFMSWIETHIKGRGCQSIELNTYVQNYPSHKFYYNEGFEILGYHFLKKVGS